MKCLFACNSKTCLELKGSSQLENANLDCHCGINAEMFLRKQNALLAFIWYICKVHTFHLDDRDMGFAQGNQ